jgi:hypothetical protein
MRPLRPLMLASDWFAVKPIKASKAVYQQQGPLLILAFWLLIYSLMFGRNESIPENGGSSRRVHLILFARFVHLSQRNLVSVLFLSGARVPRRCTFIDQPVSLRNKSTLFLPLTRHRLLPSPTFHPHSTQM